MTASIVTWLVFGAAAGAAASLTLLAAETTIDLARVYLVGRPPGPHATGAPEVSDLEECSSCGLPVVGANYCPDCGEPLSDGLPDDPGSRVG